MIRTYMVDYQVGSNAKELRTRCVTSPTYKTDFESLRSMIAIKHGVKVNDINVTLVRLLTVENMPTTATVTNIHGPNYGAIQM